MVWQYFLSLQLKRFNRYLVELGLYPIVGYLLILIGFVVGSALLFEKVEFAPYLYSAAALFGIAPLSEQKRNDFLKSCFSSANYLKLRIFENILISVPFVIFLMYQAEHLTGLFLLVAALVSSLINFNPNFHRTLPTPFFQQPFEFTAGFRKTILAIGGLYLLTIIAISVHNFDLGVMALVFLFMVCLFYYSKPEPSVYVWIFNTNPKRFLISKCKTAIVYFTILCLPMLIGMGIFFFRIYPHLAGLLIFGVLLLSRPDIC